ncbi:hypothetical protein AgCh_025657 [Apium graveolens]
MDVNANSQSSVSTNLNHPDRAAIVEDSSSINVGKSSAGCFVTTSDNNHGSDGDDNNTDEDDDFNDDDNDLYDDNDYDYMFYGNNLPPGVEASVPDRRRAIPANLEKELDSVHKYLIFKRFDSVDNFSDHRYLEISHGIQPSSTWSKKIQDEWNILENNLPDTIYVRVCERRMDLMRAVIIGPTGTPYHDGLFVFDVHFPSNYPSVPPKVTYHSSGLRINPNLYECGKVCLSLLNTWDGHGNEKWLPDKSTMLQVLVSIQALILNAKPFFNEPRYDKLFRGEEGKRRAYMEGADVGSDVKGNFEDLGKVKTSQLQGFKSTVATMVNMLVESFTRNGSTDCEEFRLAD